MGAVAADLATGERWRLLVDALSLLQDAPETPEARRRRLLAFITLIGALTLARANSSTALPT